MSSDVKVLACLDFLTSGGTDLLCGKGTHLRLLWRCYKNASQAQSPVSNESTSFSFTYHTLPGAPRARVLSSPRPSSSPFRTCPTTPVSCGVPPERGVCPVNVSDLDRRRDALCGGRVNSSPRVLYLRPVTGSDRAWDPPLCRERSGRRSRVSRP